jgi:hypothetical protein
VADEEALPKLKLTDGAFSRAASAKNGRKGKAVWTAELYLRTASIKAVRVDEMLVSISASCD